MLSAYITAALRKATYETLTDDHSYYGEIPALPGVWANASTPEECRDELQSVLEGWIVLGLRKGHTIPVLDAID